MSHSDSDVMDEFVRSVNECQNLSRQLSLTKKKLEKLSLVLASMERALVTSERQRLLADARIEELQAPILHLSTQLGTAATHARAGTGTHDHAAGALTHFPAHTRTRSRLYTPQSSSVGGGVVGEGGGQRSQAGEEGGVTLAGEERLSGMTYQDELQERTEERDEARAHVHSARTQLHTALVLLERQSQITAAIHAERLSQSSAATPQTTGGTPQITGGIHAWSSQDSQQETLSSQGSRHESHVSDQETHVSHQQTVASQDSHVETLDVSSPCTAIVSSPCTAIAQCHASHTRVVLGSGGGASRWGDLELREEVLRLRSEVEGLRMGSHVASKWREDSQQFAAKLKRVQQALDLALSENASLRSVADGKQVTLLATQHEHHKLQELQEQLTTKLALQERALLERQKEMRVEMNLLQQELATEQQQVAALRQRRSLDMQMLAALETQCMVAQESLDASRHECMQAHARLDLSREQKDSAVQRHLHLRHLASLSSPSSIVVLRVQVCGCVRARGLLYGSVCVCVCECVCVCVLMW